MNTRASCKGLYAKPEKRKYTKITLIINSESFGYLIFPRTKHSSNTVILDRKHPINKLPNTLKETSKQVLARLKSIQSNMIGYSIFDRQTQTSNCRLSTKLWGSIAPNLFPTPVSKESMKGSNYSPVTPKSPFPPS
jgi:hypothetical protein